MEQLLTNNQIMFTEATNRVMKRNPNATSSMELLLEEVSKEVLDMQLDAFPAMCDLARMENKKKLDTLRHMAAAGIATTGKFDSHHRSETYWSENRGFMHDFEIPSNLYAFMEHFVYKDFWHESNGKVWRPFMKAVCSRTSPITKYEAMNLLIKVKQIYGSNEDVTLTR